MAFEAYHSEIFHYYPDPIVIHNSQGTIVSGNEAAVQIFADARGRLEGLSLKGFEPENFRGGFAEMMKAVSDSSVTHLEILLQTPRKGLFSAEARIGRFSSQDDMYFCVLRDTSQKRLIEEKFRQRLDMEGAMSLIAAHFISTDHPREKLYEGLEQLGVLCDAEAVRMEFYHDDYRLFEEARLEWQDRRNLSRQDAPWVDAATYEELLAEVEHREYIFADLWKDRPIDRLFILPLKYEDELISALWIKKPKRALVYEDRIVFVMIAEMFRSYYVQRVSDSQRNQLIVRLQNKVNQLNCLIRIGDLLREKREGTFSVLVEAVNLLASTVASSHYECIEIYYKDRSYCAGHCPFGDIDEAFDLARQDRKFFQGENDEVSLRMDVYLLPDQEAGEKDLQLIQAVFLQLERYLEQENLMLESAFMEIQLRHTQRIEAMGTLASGIAHEMNTPNQYIQDNLTFLKSSFPELLSGIGDIHQVLNRYAQEIEDMPYEAVVTYAKLLDGIDLTYLAREIPMAVSQSLEGVNNQRMLIEAMRSYSHPGGAGSQVPRSINEILEEAVLLTRYEWSKFTDLDLEPGKNLPDIMCFPNDMSQVFCNLIVNSAHAIEARFITDQPVENVGEVPVTHGHQIEPGDGHRLSDEGDTPEPQGQILVRTRLVDNMVEISIRDNGVGISEKQRERIFEPFFTTKDVGKGTGQGLAIVYEIIENRHKGSILLNSEPGIGSEFRILLPVDDDSDGQS